jgi:Flp pilus assembly protein TadD
MLEVANNQATRPGDAAVYSAHWGDAYFLKGYALVELRRLPEAEAALRAAIALAPRNSQYLTELGQVQLRQRNLAGALESFTAAEAAVEFSPPQSKNLELGRALRGQGYVQIENRQLDAAEALYKRALALDAGDRHALGQLGYIQSLRGGRPGAGATQ